MTPKSLLRHKRAVSRLDGIGAGDVVSTACSRTMPQTQPDEKIKLVPDDKIRRVIICSGKVYYDLYEEREKRGIDDIYLLRIEQLYPFPTEGADARNCRASSRPRSSGARKSRGTWARWIFVDPYLEWVLNQIGAKHRRARYAGRPASASTAVGQMSLHLAQLKAFLDDALR